MATVSSIPLQCQVQSKRSINMLNKEKYYIIKSCGWRQKAEQSAQGLGRQEQGVGV